MIVARALAWMLAFGGAILAYIVTLAGAMRTVPRLYWREALVGVPLPLLAGILAGWCLWRPIPAGGAERPWFSAGIPLAIAVLALMLVAVSYFGQPEGPR